MMSDVGYTVIHRGHSSRQGPVLIGHDAGPASRGVMNIERFCRTQSSSSAYVQCKFRT